MEMETSTEPVGPLAPSAAALAVQPEGGCRAPGPGLWAAPVVVVRTVTLC